MFTGRRRPRTEFAEADDLTHAIHRAIDELMAEGAITRKFAEEPEEDDDRYNGFCARAVQVYWRLAREPGYRHLAADPDVEPYKLGKGPDAHYWIRVRRSGAVLDLNLGPDDAPNDRYPYDRGEPRRSFQPREKGSNVPHNKDARLVMERVRRNEQPLARGKDSKGASGEAAGEARRCFQADGKAPVGRHRQCRFAWQARANAMCRRRTPCSSLF
jgi:hypothetical protein